MIRKTSLLVLVGFAIVPLANAQGSHLVGTWSGNVNFDRSKMPAAPSPEAEASLTKALNEAKKTKMTMKLLSGGTFTAVIGGGTQPAKPVSLEGKWTLKGSTLTLTATKSNGAKPDAEASKPQAMTVSKDWKSIRFAPPMGMGAFFVFKKQA